jgi:hypothetical protein
VLRRGLAVAALAAAGWLLSVVFATSAAATDEPAAPPPAAGHPGADPADQPAQDPAEDDPAGQPSEPPAEPPAEDPAEDPATEPAEEPASDPAASPGGEPVWPVDEQPQTMAASAQSGPLDDFLAGVADSMEHLDHSITAFTGTVQTTAGHAIGPAHQLVARSDLDLTRLAAPAGPTGAERAAAPPAPRAPPLSPATPAFSGTSQDDASGAAVDPPRRAPAGHPGAHDPAGDHAGRPGRDEPVKTPAAPVAPGTSVSGSHDGPGSARGIHGVLTEQATFTPEQAGFTTRSRAADATGRVAGLPATSPD